MVTMQEEKPSFRFSPRQNSADKINWNEWSNDTFKQAKEQNKLILLSISAVWCHWCHVMDETTFSYEPVIKFINDNFIPVRVDSDMRPDINRRYNMGGWPTVAILKHDGSFLAGGTYIPPERFLEFLKEINELYKNNMGKSEKKLKKTQNKIKAIHAFKTLSKNMDMEVLQYIRENAIKSYDTLYGGFGIEPKFPMSELLEFLLYYHLRTGDDNTLLMLSKTLISMCEGGIFDQTEGGFFRYSTTRDWSIPHYEKMLEDNSVLLKILLEAYSVTKNEKFKESAQKIIDYMKSNLYDEKYGCFYGSQDADEEYYKLPPDKRKKAKKPNVDMTIYADKNALAVEAFLYASLIFDDDKYQRIGVKTMDFLLKMFDENQGMYHYYKNGPQLSGILADNVNMLGALINIYQYTADRKYLDCAQKIASILINKFFDDEKGGFYDDLPSDDVLRKNIHTEKEILTNSKAASALLSLDSLKDRNDYKKVVSKTLKYFSRSYKDYGLFASTYASAVDFYLNDAVHIDIVGKREDSKTIEIYKKALEIYAPNKIVNFLDISVDRAKIDIKGYSLIKYPAAYICIGSKCLEPVTDTLKLVDVLKNSSKIF